jgi:hypothetical protein
MKVWIGNYRNHWLSPYIILEKVFFWREIDYDEPVIERWATRLEPLCRAWQQCLDWVHPAITVVKIDRWDTWSMDHTLAHIVLPMLRQLQATKHGSPMIADEDVPEYLQSHMAQPKEYEWDTDSLHHLRWDWVLDEIIFEFQCKVDPSWEDAFRSGDIDTMWIPVDVNGNEVPREGAKHWQMKDGPNDTYQCDYAGMQVVEARIQNGFRLFGRYYQNLWD